MRPRLRLFTGDGESTAVAEPQVALPAHWAPLGAHFYRGTQFPARYRQGLFVANHGSRFSPEAGGAPPGYNVVFVPFVEGQATGLWEVFMAGFAGDARPLPDAAAHRTVGVAEAPDGSLYVSDDKAGRIWRIEYRGVQGMR